MLTLHLEKNNGQHILIASGRLSATEAQQFEQEAMRALEECKNALFFDFGALDYISSMGLRILLTLYKKGLETGKVVRLEPVSDFVREILAETGFDAFFQMNDNSKEVFQELNYSPVRFEEHERYMEHYRKCMISCAETSFLSVWLESEAYDIRQAYSDGFYWQQMNWGDGRYYLPPVGDWDSIDNWQGLLQRTVPAGAAFIFVPAYLLRKWQAFSDRIEVEDMRSEWDYVYSIPKLVEGKGKALSNWRADINRFSKNYPNYSIEPINEANLDEIRAFQDRWMEANADKEKMTEELIAEDRTTRFMLDNWYRLPNTVGMILRVDGKLVAYNVVEKLDEHMISGQFMKADYAYKGAGRFLKRELFASLLPQYVLVNAWGDSDLAGLRASKEAEDPIVLYKKYKVTWKG